jgi:hypothetical protein
MGSRWQKQKLFEGIQGYGNLAPISLARLAHSLATINRRFSFPKEIEYPK